MVGHRAERRIVARLRAAGATDAGGARPLPGLRWVQARRLRRMLAAGAVRQTSPGAYFLDESALRVYRRTRLRRLLATVGGGLLAALGALGLRRR